MMEIARRRHNVSKGNEEESQKYDKTSHASTTSTSLPYLAFRTICIILFFLIGVMKQNDFLQMAQHVSESGVYYSTSTVISDTSKTDIDTPVNEAQTNTEKQETMQTTNSLQKDLTTVGYAISLIKCSDKQTTTSGLLDAALIMRHSIHLQSKRNPDSGSRYDYKMYVLVHEQAVKCSQIFEDAGFEVVVVKKPLETNEITDDHLRKTIHREWCCGIDEFIKLYMFSKIPHEIVVHVDVDFAFYKPMDYLYDAILYDKDSAEGIEARSKIAIERPNEGLPDQIDAFVTRDWPQVRPGRKPLFQAGFIVARRKPSVVDEVVDVIKYHNYTPGFSVDNGWGGKGYGALVGAMAMQGVMAYYYDVVNPSNVVELNQCRYNHMGMQVKYVAQPNFQRNHAKVGQCRNNLDYCEDCTVTDIDLIHNVHYTQCRKPWNCIGVGAPGGRYEGGRGNAIDTDAGKYDHCMSLIRMWHDLRLDFENKLHSITKDDTILKGQQSDYKKDIFLGHCAGEGGKNYLPFEALPESLKKIPELYN